MAIRHRGDDTTYTIKPDSSCIVSPLLNACVRDFNQAHGNPNLSLTGKFTGDAAPSPMFPQGRPHFKTLKRESYIHNFIEHPFTKLNDGLQKYLLENRIAELSHADQLKTCGFVKFVSRNKVDHMKRGTLVKDEGYATHTKKVAKKFKTKVQNLLHPHGRQRVYKKDEIVQLPYDSLYFKSGACENNAHFEVQLRLIHDFINLLAERADSCSLQDITLVALFCDGYLGRGDGSKSRQYHSILLNDFFAGEYECYVEHCEKFQLSARLPDELTPPKKTKVTQFLLGELIFPAKKANDTSLSE